MSLSLRCSLTDSDITPTEPLKCRANSSCWRNCKCDVTNTRLLLIKHTLAAGSPSLCVSHRPELKPLVKESEVILRSVLLRLPVYLCNGSTRLRSESELFWSPHSFPDNFEKLSPPILQLDEVEFGYMPDQRLFNGLSVSADLESRICIVCICNRRSDICCYSNQKKIYFFKWNSLLKL